MAIPDCQCRHTSTQNLLTDHLFSEEYNFFFKNDLDACTYAYIQLFNRPNKDSESELMFVFLDSVSSLNPIISVYICA